MNFKKITAENWLKPDPVMRRFSHVNMNTGDISEVRVEQLVDAFMQPQLGDGVPGEVVELVEAARGAMLYGWFFYPLYAIAENQLFIAAEAALRAKYVAVTKTTLPPDRLPRFKSLRGWALKNGVIPEGDVVWWKATEGLRNSTAHTPIQRLGTPGDALHSLRSTCTRINSLYASPTG